VQLEQLGIKDMLNISTVTSHVHVCVYLHVYVYDVYVCM